MEDEQDDAPVPSPPSTLNLDRSASAVRSGRAFLRPNLQWLDAAQVNYHATIADSCHNLAIVSVTELTPQANDNPLTIPLDGGLTNDSKLFTALRSNRLSLLKDVNECFTSFADFSRIMVQGT